MLILLIVAAVIGTSLTIGAPWMAVPLVFLILVMWGGARLATARGGRPGIGDEDVSGEPVEFTEEDRRTLTPPSAIPPGRPGSERA
jgi:hypothetical protein